MAAGGAVLPRRALLCCSLASLWLQGCGASLDVVDRPYAYMSYSQTMSYFRALETQCPDIIQVWVAQDEFPGMLGGNRNQRWGTCEGKPCQTLVARITNKQKLTETTPEVYLSGAVHGNERIGPLVVTELAGFLCRQYKHGEKDVVRLVDSVSTWITPMTNAEGYANNHRGENGIDPNRDFPYMRDPRKCMVTQTARTVNELFRRHLFHYMITFHGGMRALTYEWGSRNHLRRKSGRSSSTESPDDRAFEDVGKVIRDASGRCDPALSSCRSSWWYALFGRITDYVYAVDGGMEDWSYGAGFEASPNPITVCRPTTYGGYDPKRTQYRPDSLSTLVYLAEMDDYKTPPEGTLGRTTQIRGNARSDGHVARNMRMCLRVMEMARPQIVLLPTAPMPTALAPHSAVPVQFYGWGCISLTSVRVLLIPRAMVDGCATLQCPAGRLCTSEWRSGMLSASLTLGTMPAATRCHGLSLWAGPPAGASIVNINGSVPADAVTGQYCVAAAAEFDQDWQKQKHPDPNVKPRSIAVRSRTEEHFTAAANDGNMKVDEYRTKLFSVHDSPVALSGVPGAKAPAPTAPPAAQGEEQPVGGRPKTNVTAIMAKVGESVAVTNIGSLATTSVAVTLAVVSALALAVVLWRVEACRRLRGAPPKRGALDAGAASVVGAARSTSRAAEAATEEELERLEEAATEVF